MSVTRRVFLRNGALALAGVGLEPVFPSFLGRSVFAAEPEKAGGGRRVLVCLFQRGAVDGLNMVVPHGDPDYYRLRTTLAIPRTGARGDAVLDLDGFYGLHPALAPLKPLYDAGRLAAIHACGSPDATRSHFDAQDYMETGAPGDKKVSTGWLTRTLAACPEDSRKPSPMRAVSMTPSMPRSLYGDDKALSIPDLTTFGIAGAGRQTRAAEEGFEAMYAEATGDVFQGAGRDSFEAIRVLKGLNPRDYRPASGATYPRGRLGDSLRQIAQLIKADVGLEVAFAESGGWDTHVNQGAAQGQFANRLREFGLAIAAFYTDLGDRIQDVVLLTMSEFGRTARQNGGGGTDHGHATSFLALGGSVQGGKVYGEWPGLAPESLHDGRDLALTTDFRDVFGEIAAKHLGARSLSSIFPKHTASAERFRGIIRV